MKPPSWADVTSRYTWRPGGPINTTWPRYRWAAIGYEITAIALGKVAVLTELIERWRGCYRHWEGWGELDVEYQSDAHSSRAPYCERVHAVWKEAWMSSSVVPACRLCRVSVDRFARFSFTSVRKSNLSVVRTDSAARPGCCVLSRGVQTRKLGGFDNEGGHSELPMPT